MEIPQDKYGQFFGGDSYVLLYSYEKNGKPQNILYFWQGRTSSSDEKGASALLTKVTLVTTQTLSQLNPNLQTESVTT